MNPELFLRVGIKPPKGVLLYGPPGTGKTLLARAVAATLQTNFLKVVSSAIVDKYIGESARVVREMFGYARDHEPCVIFMDEIDAIGGRRFSEGTSADREIQRTLMEVGLSIPFLHVCCIHTDWTTVFCLAFESNGWI
jgi:26S proteasome regulatory subunit T4